MQNLSLVSRVEIRVTQTISAVYHFQCSKERKFAAKKMPSPAPLQYSVVVPVRDEAGNIAPLVGEIVTALESLAGADGFEIIYVDDGSQDKTFQELSEATQSITHLKTVKHEDACGQSQALVSGVSKAKAPWVITLDGDGQNDPADIRLLIEARDQALEREPDLVPQFLFLGHRRLRHDSLFRRYQSWLANDIRGWLLGDHTPDAGCGLKLFRRDLFMALPRFDALHRFLPALVLRAGGRAVSVEISHRPRLIGKSKYGLWRRLALGVVDLLGVMWLMARHTRPQVSSKKDIA